jgi:hypothetical protein
MRLFGSGPDGKESSMSKLAKKKYVSAKQDGPASKGRDKATNKKKLQPVKDQKLEAEAIERAVYDGMQDLRVKKFQS